MDGVKLDEGGRSKRSSKIAPRYKQPTDGPAGPGVSKASIWGGIRPDDRRVKRLR